MISHEYSNYPNEKLLGISDKIKYLGEVELQLAPRINPEHLYNSLKTLDRKELFELAIKSYKERHNNTLIFINKRLCPCNYKDFIKEYKQRYSKS